nr:AAA family ATPase [Methanobacterium formicicum]
MIIESLHMTNFKSHRDTRIEFDTGISIIIGGNGAGKSSILEAVSFALFKQYTSKKN